MAAVRLGDVKNMEPNNFEIQNPVRPYMVEYCWSLPIGKLGRGILRPGKGLKGKQGTAIINDYDHFSFLRYQVLLDGRPRVEVAFEYKGRTHTDTIYLTSKRINFGKRPYWLCSCGYVAATLYHRPGYYGWGCRNCRLNLRYKLTTINKNTAPGRILYTINRSQKIKELGVEFRGKPLSYGGKPTHRFQAYIKNRIKWTIAPAIVEAAFARLGQ